MTGLAQIASTSSGGTVALVVVAGAAVLALIPMYIARYKGRRGWIYYVWGLLAFLPTLIVALVVSPTDEGRRRLQQEAGLWVCPFCAEMIRPEATVCRYCGRDLPDEADESEAS